ncbi:unnamed protein product [Urochloa humidicola]
MPPHHHSEGLRRLPRPPVLRADRRRRLLICRPFPAPPPSRSRAVRTAAPPPFLCVSSLPPSVPPLLCRHCRPSTPHTCCCSLSRPKHPSGVARRHSPRSATAPLLGGRGWRNTLQMEWGKESSSLLGGGQHGGVHKGEAECSIVTDPSPHLHLCRSEAALAPQPLATTDQQYSSSIRSGSPSPINRFIVVMKQLLPEKKTKSMQVTIA